MSPLPESRAGTLVKICGLRSPEDLTAAEGADWIGVVVDVPGSPRSRTVEQARGLFRRAEGRYGTVAVLVSPDAAKVRQVLDEAAPDRVQVHGPVPTALPASERSRVIPSLALPPPGAASSAVRAPRGSWPWLHLDSSGGPLPGGTGRLPDWSVARTLVELHPDSHILLGGGLTPENVAEAVRTVRPRGVDVSSGVEARPGEKSRAKIERFLAAVRDVPPRGPGTRALPVEGSHA